MKNIIFATTFSLLLISFNCAHSEDAPAGSKGVGPVQSLKLDPLNEALAKDGKGIFTTKCSACHKMAERYVGPALKDVIKKRQPEWIMNMILNPIEMTQKDPAAQELLGEYLTQMTFQDVSLDQAKKILEYFRWYSDKGDFPDETKKPEIKPTQDKKTKKKK